MQSTPGPPNFKCHRVRLCHGYCTLYCVWHNINFANTVRHPRIVRRTVLRRCTVFLFCSFYIRVLFLSPYFLYNIVLPRGAWDHRSIPFLESVRNLDVLAIYYCCDNTVIYLASSRTNIMVTPSTSYAAGGHWNPPQQNFNLNMRWITRFRLAFAAWRALARSEQKYIPI